MEPLIGYTAGTMSNRISLDTVSEVNLFLTAAEGRTVEVQNAAYVEGKTDRPGIYIVGRLARNRNKDKGNDWCVWQKLENPFGPGAGGYGIGFQSHHVAYAESLVHSQTTQGSLLIVLK